MILDIPTTFEGLYEKIRLVGELLDVPDEAAQLADRVEDEADTALALAADAAPTRMAYVYTRGPDVLLLFGADMVTHPILEGAAGTD